MNEILVSFGIESWKPALGWLLLPPLPLLLLILAGAWQMARRPLLGWLLVLTGVAALWLACTGAVSGALTRGLTRPPPALTDAAVTELRRAPRTAIVVLGGGRRVLAPEYGMSTLNARSLERLRYGLWLARETALPVAFAGGVGHGALAGPSEAEVAARVAEREFGRPLRWTEGESRDTRENALRAVALLRQQGIERVVLVTHDYHMRRALRHFEAAAAGQKFVVTAAPMGLPKPGRLRWQDWLPSAQHLDDTAIALHEWLGYLGGA